MYPKLFLKDCFTKFIFLKPLCWISTTPVLFLHSYLVEMWLKLQNVNNILSRLMFYRSCSQFGRGKQKFLHISSICQYKAKMFDVSHPEKGWTLTRMSSDGICFKNSSCFLCVWGYTKSALVHSQTDALMSRGQLSLKVTFSENMLDIDTFWTNCRGCLSLFFKFEN